MSVGGLLLERLLSAPSAARSSLSPSQPPRKAPSVRGLRSMLGLTLRTRRWRGASCTHPASPQRALSTPQASKPSARTWQPPPARGVVESRRPGCLRARAGAGTGTVPGVRGLLPRLASGAAGSGGGAVRPGRPAPQQGSGRRGAGRGRPGLRQEPGPFLFSPRPGGGSGRRQRSGASGRTGPEPPRERRREQPPAPPQVGAGSRAASEALPLLLPLPRGSARLGGAGRPRARQVPGAAAACSGPRGRSPGASARGFEPAAPPCPAPSRAARAAEPPPGTTGLPRRQVARDLSRLRWHSGAAGAGG